MGGFDVRRDGQTGGRGTAWNSLLLTAGLAFGTGCTMCPSPFDYSGTVPGAADQNDFRVRNNGILPIWRRPRPWPPVVSNSPDGRPGAGPIADDRSGPEPVPRQIAATAGRADREQNVSVLLTAGRDAPEIPGEVVPAVHDASPADAMEPVADEPPLVAPNDAPDEAAGQAAQAD